MAIDKKTLARLAIGGAIQGLTNSIRHNRMRKMATDAKQKEQQALAAQNAKDEYKRYLDTIRELNNSIAVKGRYDEKDEWTQKLEIIKRVKEEYPDNYEQILKGIGIDLTQDTTATESEVKGAARKEAIDNRKEQIKSMKKRLGEIAGDPNSKEDPNKLREQITKAEEELEALQLGGDLAGKAPETDPKKMDRDQREFYWVRNKVEESLKSIYPHLGENEIKAIKEEFLLTGKYTVPDQITDPKEMNPEDRQGYFDKYLKPGFDKQIEEEQDEEKKKRLIENLPKLAEEFKRNGSISQKTVTDSEFGVVEPTGTDSSSYNKLTPIQRAKLWDEKLDAQFAGIGVSPLVRKQMKEDFVATGKIPAVSKFKDEDDIKTLAETPVDFDSLEKTFESSEVPEIKGKSARIIELAKDAYAQLTIGATNEKEKNLIGHGIKDRIEQDIAAGDENFSKLKDYVNAYIVDKMDAEPAREYAGWLYAYEETFELEALIRNFSEEERTSFVNGMLHLWQNKELNDFMQSNQKVQYFHVRSTMFRAIIQKAMSGAALTESETRMYKAITAGVDSSFATNVQNIRAMRDTARAKTSSTRTIYLGRNFGEWMVEERKPDTWVKSTSKEQKKISGYVSLEEYRKNAPGTIAEKTSNITAHTDASNDQLITAGYWVMVEGKAIDPKKFIAAAGSKEEAIEGLKEIGIKDPEAAYEKLMEE